MADLIIWNTFNTNTSYGHALPHVSKSAVRTSGPHQLSVWLSQFGYNIKVIDFCHHMSKEDLLAITEKHIGKETLGVGVSTTFWSDYSSNKYEEPTWVVEARKELTLKHPELEWYLGGAVAFMGRMYRHKWKMFASYAEDDFLKHLNERTGKTEYKPFTIQCLTHHFGDDAAIQSYEVLPIQLSRGCQFKCKFCSGPLLGKKKGSYYRDFNMVKDEILSNYERFGTTRYYYIDETVNESMDKVEFIAKMATELPFKMEWVGYNRLDLIASYPEMIDLLRVSGLRSAFFGIESFHPKASLAVGKGWNGKHAKDFLLKLRDEWKDDINWTLSFVVGLPHEDLSSLEETQRWCIDNKMYAWLWNALWMTSPNPAAPYRSVFEDEAEKYGFKFSNTHNKNSWYTDNWNAHEATDVAIRLMSEQYLHGGLATWNMAQFAQTTEMSFSDAMNRKQPDTRGFDLQLLTKIQVDRYVKAQLSN